MGTPLGEPSPFIVGVPRSGTTLLRMMLDAHPDLAIPPETDFIPEVVRACEQSLYPRSRFVEWLVFHRFWEDFQIDPDTLDRRVASLDPFSVGEALRVFYRLYAAKHSKTRWGDKSPRYLWSMRLIQSLLPEARFIHIIRDGRDVALSVIGLWFGPSSVQEASDWWVSRIKAVRKQVDGLSHYREFRYEDLVLETERTLRKISSFLGLAWDPAMLAYHTRSSGRLEELRRSFWSPDIQRMVSAKERADLVALASAPPEASRVGRWKREMTRDDQLCFARSAGELLRELGYET